jgi:hypothetical protein
MVLPIITESELFAASEAEKVKGRNLAGARVRVELAVARVFSIKADGFSRPTWRASPAP